MHSHDYVLNEVRGGCPCGAQAERPYGLCRKCRARALWRRRNGRDRVKARRTEGSR